MVSTGTVGTQAESWPACIPASLRCRSMTIEMGPDPAEPSLRASDADREAVVERLQVACGEGRITADELLDRMPTAYAARTRAELMPLTADLPVSADGPAAGVFEVPMSRADSGPPFVAVFGGTERKGRWRPARRETAVAVFGGVELDFRDAELPPGELELRAYAVFGGIDITVPEGVRVELTGFAVFGGRDVKASGAAPGGSTGTVIRLHAVAIFGGVTAKAKPREPQS